jgi:hypothetical protein
MTIFVYNVGRKGHIHTVKVPARSRKQADMTVKQMQGRKTMDIAFVRTERALGETPATRTMRSVKVDTSQFVNAHCREPSGFATWWFRIGGHNWSLGCKSTYEQAVQGATIEARVRGTTTLEVLSHGHAREGEE